MTRFSLDHELEKRLEEVRHTFLVQRRRIAFLRMGLATFLAVLVWILPLEIAPTQPWLHVLGFLAFLGVMVVGAWRWLRPLTRSVTTEQVARYIDENHPELQDRLTGLVGLDTASKPVSQLLNKRFLQESQSMVARHPFTPWFGFQRRRLQLWPVCLLFIATTGLLVWHYRANMGIWQPLGWTGPAASFTVKPGHAKVRPGEDLAVLVKFGQANPQAATIRWRRHGEPWQEAVMQASDDAAVCYYQYAQVQHAFEYQIKDGKDVSPIFLVQLWEPPDVEAIDLVYTYPKYLQLPVREVAFSGHITAVAGTRVELEVQVNKALHKAIMVFENAAAIELTKKSEFLWQATIQLTKTDKYHLELEDLDRETNPNQPHYDVVVQPDKPPLVKIDFPRTDMEVSLLDELSFDFRVSDDFGLNDFGLRYQVAGRDPVWVSLKPEDHQGLEAKGHYQLMLEEMRLQPGDLLTWTIYAHDQKPDRPEFQVMAEPYFLEIRPFKREYREAVTQAGLQSGGPQSDLVEKQKEVLIATWNLRKRAADLDEVSYEKDRSRIHQVQIDIRDEVKRTSSGEGGLSPDMALPLVLGEAVTHLAESTWPNPEVALSAAADAEQRAFQLLLKMQPNRAQVSRARQPAGGGGQSGQDDAMSELEMNRNRNYYEEEQLTQQQSEAAAETLQQIKDLARRQKMLNDEIAKLISEHEQHANEEAMRRKLERLREELQKSLEQIDEAQRNIRQSQMDSQGAKQAERQLDQARRDVQDAMENLQQDTLQKARTANRSATAQLEKTSRDLSEQTRTSAKDRMQDLQRELGELQALEEAIRKRLASRDEATRSEQKLSGGDRGDQIHQDLLHMKKALGERFREAMERAAKLAELTAGNQELLSRKMGDWLRETSRDGLLEMVAETEEMVQYGMWDSLAEKEKEIAEKLAKARAGLNRVATMAVGDETEATEKALQALRQLRQSWESAAGQNPQDDMRRFVAGDYRQWLNTLRDVEDLLPGDHRLGPQLNEIRRQVEKARKDYRRQELEPKYDIFLQQVSEPLTQVIESLSLDVARLRQERAFVLVDDGSVPDRYRKKVADYFEALSHAERNDPQ